MRTDDIAVDLRPRNDFEAVDLGIALGRAWSAQFVPAWLFAYALPAFAIVALAPRPFLGVACAWLLRPWAERAILIVMARRFFDHPITVRQALVDTLRAPAHFGPWLASVTWRRLSPVRTAWLAVWELEGLRGQAARARMHVLTARGYGTCVAAAVLGLAATVLTMLALVGLALALVPDPMGERMTAWLDGDVPLLTTQGRTWALLLIASDALCAPWVTAAQFGWYVSRRTDLEAWDIEIVFRALARRVAAPLVLAIALLFPAPVVRAQESVELPDAIDAEVEADISDEEFDPAEAIATILEAPEFGRNETVQQWQLRRTPQVPDARPPAWLDALFDRLAALGTLSRGATWAFLAFVVAAIVRLVWRRGRWRTAGTAASPVETEFEFAATPGTDEDVVARARQAIDEGRVRDAMGHLYRGVVRFAVRRGLYDARPGDTEGDCLRQVRGRLDPDAERAVRDVVRAWQGAAYARREPSVERARAMCDAYGSHLVDGPA
ncbi:MAG: DUF4129 domain-containing protein [Acidobacteria bacterium]|nr:DUF4129 domain-containing protein [Acidobacteriota bacterium]